MLSVLFICRSGWVCQSFDLTVGNDKVFRVYFFGCDAAS